MVAIAKPIIAHALVLLTLLAQAQGAQWQVESSTDEAIALRKYGIE
jgi:hypothetical protein